MQAAVERVIRSFIMKQPMAEDASTEIHDGAKVEAMQFAAQLLDNYKSQLAQRGCEPDTAQQG